MMFSVKLIKWKSLQQIIFYVQCTHVQCTNTKFHKIQIKYFQDPKVMFDGLRRMEEMIQKEKSQSPQLLPMVRG